MKRLTINHIAAANLKQNRRAYLSMTIGIFLSIFLITAMCLSIQGMIIRSGEKVDEIAGTEDMLVIDIGMTDQELLEMGYFQPDMGHVYLTALTAEGAGVGSYDELAEEMLLRKFVEGRMPEKAGEVAMEASALGLLRKTVGVGDTVTLNLMPLDGIAEERTYTLVGILTEQSAEMNQSITKGSYADGESMRMPSILLSREEPAFATGRIAVHQLVMLRPGVSPGKVLRATDNGYYGHFYGVDAQGMLRDWDGNFNVYASAEFQEILLMALIIGSMVIAVCVGISGAMESQLAHKTEEIGMLRAVGATKRQIRRIFGREAWLLALVILPAAMLLGVAFAWGLARMLPALFTFKPTLSVLGPVLGLTVVTILASSFLPLYHASSIMPMSVLRDTNLLRRSGSIRSKKQFKVASLMSWRQLRLHPTRQLGAALLVAVMLFLAGETTHSLVSSIEHMYRPEAAFSITDTQFFYLSQQIDYFLDYVPELTLTEGDISQLASLPMVKDVRVAKDLQVVIPVDRVSDYMIDEFRGNDHMRLSSYWDKMNESMGTNWETPPLVSHRALQGLLGTDKYLLQLPLTIVSRETLEGLAIDDGKLDLAAIDAGREVAVYVPDIYVLELESNSVYKSTSPDTLYTSVEKDDYFTAGMTLPITQLCGAEPSMTWGDDEFYENLYRNAERHDATVTVGSVSHAGADISRIGLLTTAEGLRAMGLNGNKFDTIAIYLNGTPDAETEAWLEQRITEISYRAPGLNVYNQLWTMRSRQAEQRRNIMGLAGIIAVFFAAALGLITGTVSRRIRADSRTIGTLRAVGADERVLAGCYRGSILTTVVLGLLGALVLVGIELWADTRYMDSYSRLYFGKTLQHYAQYALLPMIALDAAMLGCCLMTLRLRVREIVKKSIVENIKEL